LGQVLVSPGVFWRRNRDDFDINISGDWFSNAHQSDTAGTSVRARFDSVLGTTALGGEIVRDTLESSNLGDHDRNRQGLFFEQKFSPVEKVTLGAGASAMKYTDWGWKYWPGADIQIDLAANTTGYASAAKSFRVPTYTEMYYNNAANKGDPELKPENAWTCEIGVRRMKSGLGSSASLFYRDAQNLIDWTRKTGETTWKAGNISQSKVRGAELALEFYPGILFDMAHNMILNLSYTFIDADFDAGQFESRYVLDQLGHQVNGAIRVNWSAAWSQTLKARYEKRMVSDSHVAVDTRLAFRRNDWELFCDITNITDSDYVDNGFAPAPGRWIIAGVSVDFL
jgi:vitamin B12 transporter